MDFEHIKRIDLRVLVFSASIIGMLFFGYGTKKTIEYAQEPEWLIVPEAELILEDVVEEKEVIAKEVIEEEIVIPEIVEIIPEPSLGFTPDIINAVYLTGWSAGNSGMVQYVIDLAKSTDVNAVVIDIKDYSGFVLYDTQILEVEKYGAQRILIPNITSVIQRLHKERIYVIARIVVFQDPILAKAREEIAVQSILKIEEEAESILWEDNKGLSWIDPAAKEAWEYNAKIGREAINLGFDELNFDYIRFPSDGDIQDMSFPVWNEITKLPLVLRDFFKYISLEFEDTNISADVFGLATIWDGDFGIGQVIEDTFEYFDFVSPMIYPSHYAENFLGYEDPDEHPYEVVKYSMDLALLKLQNYAKENEHKSKLRPWLQDFELGVEYTNEMVLSQVEATKDAMLEDYAGFMMWSPRNIYTIEALK